MRYVILSLLLLGGCASTAPQDVVVQCPVITDYNTAQMKDIKEAIHSLPNTSPLVSTMLDYERLRDSARACVAAQRK